MLFRSDSEACKEKNEAYYARQKMLEEKAKAKKAMKQAGEAAPSIIVSDDEEPDETDKPEEKSETSEENSKEEKSEAPEKTEEE